MELVLSNEELENVIYNCLCDAVGTGYLGGYGLTEDLEALNYNKYRAEGDCFEDVVMKALRAGEAFHVIDEEGDGEYNASFTLAEARERLSSEKIALDIMDVVNEMGDVITADSIIQTALYGEIIFG